MAVKFVRVSQDDIFTLRDGQGDHLIPVWTDEALTQALDLAKVLRVPCQVVPRGDAFPHTYKVTDEQDLRVVSWATPELAEFAYIYAYLTNRRCIEWSEFLGERRHGQLDVLFVSTSALDSFFLSSVLEHSKKQASVVGLLACESIEDAKDQVTLRAATVLAGALDFHLALDIRPALQIDQIQTPSRIVLGEKANVGAIRRELHQTPSIVSISSHSDGIDTLLGNGVLCNIPFGDFKKKIEAYNENDRVPVCVSKRYCHRVNLPFGTIGESERILRPSEIASPILNYDVCYGLLPINGRVDRTWAIFRGLLANSRIGAIVTGWTTRFASTDDFTPMLYWLQTGAPLGYALFKCLQSRNWDRFHTSVCLFGDPAIKFSPCALDLRVPKLSHSKRRQRVELPRLRQLRLILEAALNSAINPSPETSKRYELAHQKCRQYEILLNQTHSVKILKKLREQLHTIVLQALGSHPQGWNGVHAGLLSTSQGNHSVIEGTSCPNCGSAAQGVPVSEMVSAEKRMITMCGDCGYYSDLPLCFHSKLLLIVNDVTVSLKFKNRARLQGDYKLSIFLAGKGGNPRFRWIPWPIAESDGRFLNKVSLTFAENQPPNGREFGLMLIRGLQLSVINSPGNLNCENM